MKNIMKARCKHINKNLFLNISNVIPNVRYSIISTEIDQEALLKDSSVAKC